MEDKIVDAASSIHQKFSSLPGGDHIATPVNIAAIIDLCRKEQPKRVLELGGGIGTLSYTVLANSAAFVDIYEDNEFCRQQLDKNLRHFEGRYEVVPEYRILPPERAYDLMVIDGGHRAAFRVTWFFLRYIDLIKTIYIEGKRRAQYTQCCRALSDGYRFDTVKVNGRRIDGAYHKGGTLIRCHPSNSYIGRAFSYVRGRLKEDRLLYRMARKAQRLLRSNVEK